MRPRQLVVLVAVLIAVAGSSGGTPGSQLVVPTAGGDGSVGLAHVPYGKPFLIQAYPMCLERPGPSAQILKVTVKRAEGRVKVVDWAQRYRHPGDPYPGLEPGSGVISVLSVPGYTHKPTTHTCRLVGNDYWGYQMDLNVVLESPTAFIHGFWVTYRSAGHTFRALDSYGMGLCHKLCPQRIKDEVEAAGRGEI